MTVVDHYNLVETGLADRLRAALKLEYFTNPSTRKVEDWRVSDNDSHLQRGADYFIVMRPGGFPSLPTSYKTGEIQDVDWESFARLYVKFKEREEQWSTFKPFRAAVIDAVMKYRLLGRVTINGDTIAEVPAVDRVRSIEASEPASYWWFLESARQQGLPPNYMYQPLRIVTRQRVRFV